MGGAGGRLRYSLWGERAGRLRYSLLGEQAGRLKRHLGFQRPDETGENDSGRPYTEKRRAVFFQALEQGGGAVE
jgi:hypothetical protein